MDMPQPQQILSKSVACGNKFISVFTYQLRNSAATTSEDGKHSVRQTDRKGDSKLMYKGNKNFEFGIAEQWCSETPTVHDSIRDLMEIHRKSLVH